MAASLLQQDRLLLGLLQDRFPLAPVPFTDLAERLGWRESEVLARVEALKEQGPLRQIGAIFDSRRLGYSSTLVALAVEPARLDEVARAVSRHPGVSHCYSRAHPLNLWFTLGLPPGRDLAREAAGLAGQPGVQRSLALPAVRTFKIDTRVELGAGLLRAGALPPERPAGPPLAAADIPCVRVLQDDLPLVQRPFHLLAQREGLAEDDLLAAARRFLADGTMRRYGATLRHRQAGYTANAMACWQVGEGRIAAAGLLAAGQPAVSHCYQRLAYPPEWPYQLYTMVHGRSEGELAAAVAGLEALMRPQRMAVLPTVKEYKKVRLRYFE